VLDLLSGRPVEDILGRVARITLGGTEHQLTVLTIAGNKRWKAELDRRLSGLLEGLDASKNRGEVLGRLEEQVDDLLDLVIAYDTDCGNRPGVLPDRSSIEEVTTPAELLAALREVWRAANPFAMAALRPPTETTAEAPPSASPQPTSTARRRTAGSRKKSKAN